MNIINNSQVLGSLSKDLVLNTLGKVYIRTGDRYHELDFKSVVQGEKDPEIKEIITDKKEQDVIIVKSISNLDYPGDNKFIVSLDGNFYVTLDGKLKHVNKELTSDIKETSNILEQHELYLNNKFYSNNIVVDFSSGEIYTDSLEADNLKVKKINKLKADTVLKERFINGSGEKLYIGPELRIKHVYQDDNNSDYVYFIPYELKELELFPIKEIITNDKESFDAKVIEVTEEYIKAELIPNDDGVVSSFDDVDGTDLIIIKADVIRYDEKGKSIYNKKYYIRVANADASGKYLDFEYLYVNSDVDLELRAGTILHCLGDCKVSIKIGDLINQYELFEGTLYMAYDDSCDSINRRIRYFQTLKEFNSASLLPTDISFIKETSQLYYKGIFVGGKIEEMQERIENLETEVYGIGDEIDGFYDTIDTLNKTIKDCLTTISNLEERIKTLENNQNESE